MLSLGCPFHQVQLEHEPVSIHLSHCFPHVSANDKSPVKILHVSVVCVIIMK